MQSLTWPALGFGLLVASCGLITRNERPSSNDGGAGEPETGAAAGSGGAIGHGNGGGEASRSVTGSGGSGDSSESGAAGAEASSTDPLAGNSAICSGYVTAWRTREAEQASGETACLECLGYRPSCFASRDAVTDGQHACFRRHCLCDPADPSCDAPTDACACFGSCLPDPPSPVRQSWLDYMACELESCADVCDR